MAAAAPPADSPATKTRPGSPASRRSTSRASPARMAGSPAPRRWSPGANQFQHRCAFAEAGCEGYATSIPCASANSFIRVPAAKSSGDWVQPCSMRSRGAGPGGRAAGM